MDTVVTTIHFLEDQVAAVVEVGDFLEETVGEVGAEGEVISKEIHGVLFRASVREIYTSLY